MKYARVSFVDASTFPAFCALFPGTTCYLRQRPEGGNEGRRLILEREMCTVLRFSRRAMFKCSTCQRAAAESVTSLQRDYLESAVGDRIARRRNKTNSEY